MTELDLFKMMVALVPPAVAERNGGTGLGIMLAYQPTQLGASDSPLITMHTVSTRRVGWAARSSKWDAAAGIMVELERQVCETTLQFTMRADSTGSDTAPTETDLLQIVADAVQSNAFIASCGGYGAQLLRVTDIRAGRFIGDNGQNANWPSFDMVVTYNRSWQSVGAVVETWDGLGIHAIL